MSKIKNSVRMKSNCGENFRPRAQLTQSQTVRQAASYDRTTDALPDLNNCPHSCDGVIIGRANKDSMDLAPRNGSRPCDATLLSSSPTKISSDMETNREPHSNDGISIVTHLAPAHTKRNRRRTNQTSRSLLPPVSRHYH